MARPDVALPRNAVTTPDPERRRIVCAFVFAMYTSLCVGSNRTPNGTLKPAAVDVDKYADKGVVVAPEDVTYRKLLPETVVTYKLFGVVDVSTSMPVGRLKVALAPVPSIELATPLPASVDACQ